MGRGFTVMHIYRSDLKYLYIAVPPVAEQAAIVRFLDHVDRRIRRYVRAMRRLVGAAASQAGRGTSLVDEYRTRLIADVVTGKLDVREAAVHLPEVDSAEIEDDGDDGVDRAAASAVSESAREATRTEPDAADCMIDERRHAAGQEGRP